MRVLIGIFGEEIHRDALIKLDKNFKYKLLVGISIMRYYGTRIRVAKELSKILRIKTLKKINEKVWKNKSYKICKSSRNFFIEILRLISEAKIWISMYQRWKKNKFLTASQRLFKRKKKSILEW